MFFNCIDDFKEVDNMDEVENMEQESKKTL
jgi:hypothetical protein